MQGLEFAAVQIIAVDSVHNRVLCKASYLLKAGHYPPNPVSTGDLNRGRRACPACFLCYFLHAAKSNNPSPFRELPDKQEVCPCRGSTLRVLLLPFSLKHGRLAHIRSQFSLFRRLRRTKTCHWQFFARPSREFRGFANLESAHRKGGIAENSVKPA